MMRCWTTCTSGSSSGSSTKRISSHSFLLCTYGQEAWQKCNGWSTAAWTKRHEKHFSSRDRLGEKGTSVAATSSKGKGEEKFQGGQGDSMDIKWSVRTRRKLHLQARPLKKSMQRCKKRENPFTSPTFIQLHRQKVVRGHARDNLRHPTGQPVSSSRKERTTKSRPVISSAPLSASTMESAET